jgi:adenylate kinase
MPRSVIIRRIGVTGTPGTGKKSVSRELAKLTGLQEVSLSQLAISRHAGRWRRDEFHVQSRKLIGKIETQDKIIHGHLLPYVISSDKLDFVAVLRCSPLILRKRFKSRGYSPSKIRENLESELLDLISLKSLEVFGRNKVFEFDTSRTTNPRTPALRILQTIEGKRKREFGLAKWSNISGRSPQQLKRFIEEQSIL